MKLLTFAASQRPGSYNRMLATQATALAQTAGATVDFQEYPAFVAPLFDDRERIAAPDLPQQPAHFVTCLQQADALMLATPEYNWSIPGHLKNLIDWASCVRPYPFTNKPVLLLSASPSRRGGLLGLTHLQMVLAGLGARVYPRFFALIQAHEALDADGKLRDAALRQELEEIIRGFLAG